MGLRGRPSRDRPDHHQPRRGLRPADGCALWLLAGTGRTADDRQGPDGAADGHGRGRRAGRGADACRGHRPGSHEGRAVRRRERHVSLSRTCRIPQGVGWHPQDTGARGAGLALADHGFVFKGREGRSGECRAHPCRFRCQGRKHVRLRLHPGPRCADRVRRGCADAHNPEHKHMITAYLWGTPNGYKVAIALEEMGVDYEITWVNIGAGQQHEPEYLKISPNAKIPAIVDHETGISLMESGAILQYLAERTGTFGGETLRDRWQVAQWLHWQMGGLGPMMGQANHFRGLEEKVPYGETRYRNETARLFGVLDKQLEGRDYIVGDYSIADMAAVAWAGMAPMMADERLTACANVMAWIGRNVARPATARAIALSPD